ncbi:MAG: hypothetical protein LBN05_05745 [Oscillospiraceae bacterium]|nr:hypothetical protein [Oscillospiraceae bacterium]
MERNVNRMRRGVLGATGLTAEPQIPSTEISVVTNDNMLSPTLMGSIVKNPGLVTVYAQKKLAKDAALEAAHEQCRAILAKGAMENTVALTLLEAHLSSMVPQAADRLRAIATAFAYSAIDRFTRW